jgi:hypothetical protein
MTRAITTALILALLAPPAALGQRGGVIVDPDSPAGAEYAIPLDQARREAAGDTSGNRGEAGGVRAGGEELFGEGITPAGGGSAGGGGSDGGAGGGSSGGRSGERENASGGSATESPSGPGASASTAAVAAASEQNSGLPLTIGIAGAVLAAGLAGGLGLRRVLRDSD